jgi:hypothetical protein
VTVPIADLLERLEAYDPDHDTSEPLSHKDLLKRFPYPTPPTDDASSTWVSRFTNLAYCPYKIWHVVRGTPEVRPRRVQVIVDRGKLLHAKQEVKLLAEAAVVPVATAKELKDPLVDLVELPEVPARVKRGDWVYIAKLDGLARLGGNLTVRERKTGRWTQMPDHLLQVWAYSIAAPGALNDETKGLLRANGVSWEVQYPTQGETWGPYSFRAAQLRLLEDSMDFFEDTAIRSRTEAGFDLGWNPTPSKCAPCGFANACSWRAGGAAPGSLPRSRLSSPPSGESGPGSQPSPVRALGSCGPRSQMDPS